MNLKKILLWAAIAFVLFFLISDPNGAANAVNGGLDNLQDVGNSVSQFATAVFGEQ